MTLTEDFFIKCVDAGIKGVDLSDIPDGIDYRELLNLSIRHSLGVAVFCATKNLKDCFPEKFYSALKKVATRHLSIDVKSEIDKKTVLDKLEERGIDFMPLKGYFLKNLYPETSMRYTSDCDVLIKTSQLKQLRQVYKELNLKIERFDTHHDIVYFDATKTIFEFHKMLFVGKLSKYFGVGFERASLKKGTKHFYELSKEDYYITLLAHSAYHFADSGVGVRHLTDIYLFRKNNKLDYEYIDKELTKCGLLEFKNNFESLADFFFDGKSGDEFTHKLADYVLSSSVLANEDKKSASEVVMASNSGKGKGITVFKIIFPSLANMRFSYPVLNKHVYLLPLFYVVRWFRVLFKSPDRLSRITKVSSLDNKNIEEVREVFEKLNLKNI